MLYLLKVGVRYSKESLTSQLLIEGLYISIDSRKGHIGEVGKVLSDWDIQWVGTIENIWISLQISSSIILMLRLGIGVN